MSTITKERLLKIQQWHETYGPGSNVVLPAEEAEELARIALASLETEAVAYVDPFAFHNFSVYRAGETDNRRMGREWMWANPDAVLIPVYTTPPAPVSVPDEMTMQKALSAIDRLSWQECTRDAYMLGWNACRAAMLQGVEPDFREISNSSTKHLRENAETSTKCPCCGRKPLKNKTCSVAGCNGKHVARGFCVKHYAIERKKEPSRRESIRAADKRYRARRAAAPQQEVKP